MMQYEGDAMAIFPDDGAIHLLIRAMLFATEHKHFPQRFIFWTLVSS